MDHLDTTGEMVGISFTCSTADNCHFLDGTDFPNPRGSNHMMAEI